MTQPREDQLNKIRALMAKTVENGCTEEEALAALAKARAMMDVYEISDDELALTKEETAILRREPPDSKDPHRIKNLLVQAVAPFCGCQAWRDRDRTLTFCGLRADVQFATWLLDTLTAFVEAELVEHLMSTLAEGRHRREVIRGFVTGCTGRITERLNELRQKSKAAVTTSNAKALVVAKDAAIKAKMEEEGIYLRKCGGSTGAIDNSSYQAGSTAGNRASFGRPVSGRNATLRLK
jgi:Protein of unknown function (DUF2786)